MGKGSPKRKRNARGKAIDLADRWFSKYIRLRDHGASVLSGPNPDKVMNCGHIMRREYMATRWDEENAFCITAGENINHEQRPQHLNNWVIATFGYEYYEKLSRKAITGGDLTTQEILEIAEHWKNKYHELEARDGTEESDDPAP